MRTSSVVRNWQHSPALLLCQMTAVCLGTLFLIAMIARTATPAIAQEADEFKPSDSKSAAANEQVAKIFETFEGKGVQRDDSEPTPPGKSLETFSHNDAIAIDLVAHEPTITQPLFCTWDSRGRMWVVQYRQYQYPAGLKVVRFDQYLRAVFDRVPEPPPAGPKGLDRISILQDGDGDGVFESTKDVIDDLNIASSMAVADDGVWVLNPPYLLFYPDADHDDRPDADPEVHLSGFGIQDTHSVANSLTWGVDGWLYGANGSTTGGTIKSPIDRVGVSFEGQCIWRYHPNLERFEIFAEGGGNTFSLEIDAVGRVFSGTNSGNTRGFHYVQGGYYHKNWGKHGPLTNPYAFGYFNQMESDGDPRRFAQAFNIYESDLFPRSFYGRIVAANSLHNIVWQSDLIPNGSTYRTKDREPLITSSDRWFRPVYNGVGPDGAIYIADWYDTRLSHVSPVDDWHKTSGRIYRVRPNDKPTLAEPIDLTKQSSEQLIANFSSRNKWLRQRNVLELGWRGEDGFAPALKDLVNENGSLEALWTLHLLQRIDDDDLQRWFTHSDAHVRRWAIRLLGDGTLPTDPSRWDELYESLARSESDPQVRSQWASTAKRLPVDSTMSILRGLTQNDDRSDPHLPLLTWWALESKANQFDAIEDWLRDQSVWELPVVREEILHRLMQRYASEETQTSLEYAERLLKLAPDQQSRVRLLKGLNEAFRGRSLPVLPASLASAMGEYRQSLGEHPLVLKLQQEGEAAADEAIDAIRKGSVSSEVRSELVDVFGKQPIDKAVPMLLGLATGRTTSLPSLQRSAISALAAYQDPQIAGKLLASFSQGISKEHGLRDTACRTLASRENWALQLIEEINQWRIKASDLPADVVQRLRTFDGDQMRSAVDQALGPQVQISNREQAKRINDRLKLLSDRGGDAAAGESIFNSKCLNCHRLFERGNAIGPTLDGYARNDPKFWLTSILDPNLEIREGYQSFRALTDDGRLLTGMVAERNPKSIVLRSADQKLVTIPRDEIDVFEPLKTSLMPTGLLDDLTETQYRNLMAYLMSPQDPSQNPSSEPSTK